MGRRQPKEGLMKVAQTPRKRRFLLALALAATAALTLTLVASANVAVTIIATDPFTNPDSQHATIVEPDTYSSGSTIIAAAQWGRFTNGGSSDIGVSVSTNNGSSWTAQQLPGLTVNSSPAGPWARVSDPSVAFDAKHNVWMVSGLALDASLNGAAVTLSRSTNGGATWQNAINVEVATGTQDFDKNWTVCDNTPTSPFYGSCYTTWDDFGHGNLLKIAYSRDGGLTWTPSRTPHVGVIGAQPVVQANGGVKFSQAFAITSITAVNDPGNIRSGPLPSAEISGDGKIYVVWEDCRFRANCYTNDLVYTTSTNGTSWTAVQRIPIDATNSTVDHFIPGVGVDRNSSGTAIRVGVTYYYYPNGGSTWNAAIDVAGPMTMSWLPNTSQGRMVGDYISTSYNSSGLAFSFFARAFAPTSGGSDCQTATPNCDQGLYTFASGQAASAGTLTANDPVVYTAKTQPGHSAFAPRR